MTQSILIQRLVRFSTMAILLVPLSGFAEERPDWRTTGSQVAANVRREDVRHIRNADLEGEVLSVARDGDSFMLLTRGRRVHVLAKGGVVAYYRGERYRIRDLERGDIVAVDLFSERSRPRARSVEVLESVSHRRYERGGRYDDRRDRYDRRERYDRYDRRAGRDAVVVGQLVAIDARRERIVLRVDGRDLRVDARRLDSRQGRSWERSVHVGERVEIAGRWSSRGSFVAETIRPAGRRGRW